jgi:hypothetical protein
VLRTPAIDAWRGREAELAALDPEARQALATRWAQARTEGRRDGPAQYDDEQDCSSSIGR